MNKLHFESIDSTNAYLKKNYQNLENFTFVSASKQTQGKGRNDRKWEGENNLTFSLLLKDSKYFSLTNSISIISAYTVLEILKEYKVEELSIKWPNDIYAADKKICGILLQSISEDEIKCLIVGVGVNVNETEFNFDYLHEPTSMKNILNKDIDIEELKEKIYQKFTTNLNKLIEGYDYYEDIIKYDYLKNKEVYASINNENKLVVVKGINKDYTLRVNLNNSEYNLNSGEVSFHI